MLTELDNPQYLDLNDNKFTDESMPAFVKYVFANEECRLNYFSLENNPFTSYGKRTLLKAYSLSANKASIQFKCGPLPFSESTLKHAFNVQYDVAPKGKAKEAEMQKVLKSMNRDKLEMTVRRKANYPQYIGVPQRGLPITKADRDMLTLLLTKIDNTVNNRYNIFIEDIRDLLE